jgi:hypothetical protein
LLSELQKDLGCLEIKHLSVSDGFARIERRGSTLYHILKI